MANVTIRIPNPDAQDVLDALEKTWSKEASRINPDYSSLTATERAGACISAYLRSITKNHRRDAEVQRRREQEVPIVVVEPGIT